MPDTYPKTLIEAVQHFSDLDVCHEYMLKLKWPDGNITCPECGCDRIGHIATRRLLRCKECRKQFSAKIGTIFEDSPLPLSQWFVAVWCSANFKMGISSHELARTLGITQKSAWFMVHRIRLAMTTPSFRKLNGVVESDETFVGGLSANMHAAVRARRIRGRGTIGKAVVHGLLERNTSKKAQDSQVIAAVVPNTEAATLVPAISANVDQNAVVCTDATSSYANLSDQFVHRWVDHARRYVLGRVHVNGIENFWSLLKRAIKGTYVAVSAWHLFRYVDEEAWRFNFRRFNDGQRFDAVMRGVLGKRITYRTLGAIDDAGFMGIS
jgi:transposase-like protein